MPLLLIIILIGTMACVHATPLNHFQIIGSHNSYKQQLDAGIKAQLKQQDPRLLNKIDYGHQPLLTQLKHGVRHLELDVLKDPNGDLFLTPWAAQFSHQPLYNEAQAKQLSSPGYKVMHIPDIDVQSHCILLRVCLAQLKTWSEQHPQHFPVVVMLNVKETAARLVSSSEPLPFYSTDYQQLDLEIKSKLQNLLFTPDDLRRDELTLNQSVQQYGWPSRTQLAGKFIFLFDGSAPQTALYKANRSSLKGASMFAHYPTTEPEAAFMIVNDPIAQFNKIRQLVSQGYMVRTRADASLSDNNSQRQHQFNAAKQSGAQIISTDFIPNSPQQQRFNYVVQFDHGQLLRINPFFTH